MRKLLPSVCVWVAACGGYEGDDGTLGQAITVCPAGATVEGVDVSSWQGSINWSQVAGSGRGFGIARISDGTYLDPDFNANWAGIKNAGMIRGAYQFYEAGDDPTVQANIVINAVGKLGSGDLAVTADLESGGGVATVAQLQTWMNAVEAGTGKRPMIYTSPGYWDSYFGSQFAAYPLWVANWFVTCPDTPTGWSSWQFWQYADNGTVPGIGGRVDLDKFNGSLSQLQQLTSVQTIPPIAQVSGNDTITMANWPDKHAELFVRSPSGDEFHSWSNTTGGAWAALARLDSGAECGSAASFWGDPWVYPELFSPLSAGGTGHLWWVSGTGWNAYQAYGGSGLSHLSTFVWQDGRSEVFALGSDRALWHDWWDTANAKWSGWQSMGGSFVTGAGAIMWGNGTGELFATDANGDVWHSWFSGAGPWAAWTKMGSGMASRPVPVRWKDGHVEVFVRGQDGQLYDADFSMTSGWPAFTALSAGTRIIGEPSAIMNDVLGTAEVFARDLSGQVVHLWGNTTSGYTQFTPLLSQVSASDPFGWSLANGDAEVFVVDVSGNLAFTHRTGSTWSPFASIASGIDACSAPLPGPDAGPVVPDAGRSGTDAGVRATDAGAPGDASVEAGDSGEPLGIIHSGCGCSATGVPAVPLCALIAAGMAARPRRRRRIRQSRTAASILTHPSPATLPESNGG